MLVDAFRNNYPDFQHKCDTHVISPLDIIRSNHNNTNDIFIQYMIFFIIFYFSYVSLFLLMG